MGVTADFLKLRSTGTPKPGEWNINYDKALDLAKKSGRFIVACWSNGDNCGYCMQTEKCMMDKAFTDWMKKSDAYFVFQYSGDNDCGKVVHDWCYKNTGLKFYPGFRVTIYDKSGRISYNKSVDGNTLRGNKPGTKGSQNMIANFNAIFAKKPVDVNPSPSQDPNSYKVRLNEKLTVKKINSVLDAIDKNDGYCPCQAGKTTDTKCHCKDFKDNKKIGEPCICNIFVKQKR